MERLILTKERRDCVDRHHVFVGGLAHRELRRQNEKGQLGNIRASQETGRIRPFNRRCRPGRRLRSRVKQTSCGQLAIHRLRSACLRTPGMIVTGNFQMILWRSRGYADPEGEYPAAKSSALSRG